MQAYMAFLFLLQTLTVFATLSLSYSGKYVVLGSDPVPHVNGCSSRAVAGMLLIGFMLLSYLMATLWPAEIAPEPQEWSANTTIKQACLKVMAPYSVSTCLVVLVMGSTSAWTWTTYLIQQTELTTLQPSTAIAMVLLHLLANACFQALQALFAFAFSSLLHCMGVTIFLLDVYQQEAGGGQQ